MPVYTAQVDIYRHKKFQEEVWFENVRAGSQKEAEAKVEETSRGYVNNFSKSPGGPTRHEVRLVCRTALLGTQKGINEAFNKAKKVKAQVVNIKPPKEVKAPVIIDLSLFKDDVRGSFKDIYTFKKELSLQVTTPTPTYYGRGGHGGYYGGY